MYGVILMAHSSAGGLVKYNSTAFNCNSLDWLEGVGLCANYLHCYFHGLNL